MAARCHIERLPRLIVFLWAGLLAFVWIPGGLWVWLMKDYGFIGSYKRAINSAFAGWIFVFNPEYYDQHIGNHPLFDRMRENYGIPRKEVQNGE